MYEAVLGGLFKKGVNRLDSQPALVGGGKKDVYDPSSGGKGVKKKKKGGTGEPIESNSLRNTEEGGELRERKKAKGRDRMWHVRFGKDLWEYPQNWEVGGKRGKGRTKTGGSCKSTRRSFKTSSKSRKKVGITKGVASEASVKGAKEKKTQRPNLDRGKVLRRLQQA